MILDDLLKDPFEYPPREEVDSLVQEAMHCLPPTRTDLTSRVSHAIRTPLAAILGFKEVLHFESGVSEADRAVYAEIVEGETHRLKRFIQTLKVFKVLLSGGLQTKRSKKDLRETIELAISRCRLDAKTRKIRIEVIGAAEEIPLLADHAQVCLALEHLLLNALRASSSEGIIDVEVVQKGSNVSIIVEDSGFGMDPAQIDAMFKPFNRIPRPDDNGGELGLGLTIVRSIAERHQGTVSVESSPMEGARFILTFPL